MLDCIVAFTTLPHRACSEGLHNSTSCQSIPGCVHMASKMQEEKGAPCDVVLDKGGTEQRDAGAY